MAQLNKDTKHRLSLFNGQLLAPKMKTKEASLISRHTRSTSTQGRPDVPTCPPISPVGTASGGPFLSDSQIRVLALHTGVLFSFFSTCGAAPKLIQSNNTDEQNNLKITVYTYNIKTPANIGPSSERGSSDIVSYFFFNVPARRKA